jgi:energy-coupling factor transport system substrate-specific component
MKRNKDVCDARIAVEKSGEYEDAAEWKKKSMKGYGSMVHFSRSRKKIVVSTSNLGIELRCTIELKKNIKNVYAALTGDQCALTNIMII